MRDSAAWVLVLNAVCHIRPSEGSSTSLETFVLSPPVVLRAGERVGIWIDTTNSGGL